MELLGARGRGLAHHRAPHRAARRRARRPRAHRRGLPAHRRPRGSRRRSSSAGCRGSRRASRWWSPRSRRRSTRSPPARSTWWSATGAPDAVGALRDAIAPRALVERTALPPGTEIDDAREALARPLFTAWLGQVDGSGAARPRYTWAPGPRRGAAGPGAAAVGRVGGRRPGAAGTAEEGLGRLAPDLAAILERSLADAPPRVAEIERLFRARGAEVEAIAKVADTLRARRCGDTVTYVDQPQHQLHQPVLLPLRLLRLLARAQEPQPARRPLHPERPRGGAPLGRGLGAGRHRGLPAGRHPPGLHRRLLRLGARGHQGAPAGDARPRVHAARGLAGRPHARGAVREFLDPPARRRPGHPARHGRRDPRRPRARAPVPGQGAHRRVGGGDDHRPRARPAGDHHHDVRPHRRAARPGPTTSRCCARSSGAPAGFTEFVPLPFVHMASPIFLQGQARAGADLGRGGAGPRGRPDRPRRPDPQHPGLLGEARPGRRGAPARRPAATTSAGR